MAQGTPPGLALNGYPVPTMDNQPSVPNFGEPQLVETERPAVKRVDTNYTMASMMSVPPEGSILTGKQEHCKQQHSTPPANDTDDCADLKRELISQQTQFEISELSSPTALKRFGAPFRSDAGEVAPEDSELPLLRYIFVNHVRNFPFLDKAKEKEFWQDKLQVVSWRHDPVYNGQRLTGQFCSFLSPSRVRTFRRQKTASKKRNDES